MKKISIVFLLIGIVQQAIIAQRYPNTGYKVEVVPLSKITFNFNRHLRHWDGFGVNYVETCQTRDYAKFQQDYSGFSFATDKTKVIIMDMIFGEDGLRPAISKMFLDPFHEGMTKEGNDNDDPMKINLDGYDHEASTNQMRYFNREGMKIMKSWGGELQTITTLYSCAPWMTKQKYVLGKEADPEEKYEMAEYMASWAKYLIEKENIPVKYISFHNEGDAYYRWPLDGSNPGEDHRDYNMYWPPEQVVDFLKITREVLDANGLTEIGLSPGETQTWYRFDQWGYASAIVQDGQALKNLDLLTSHSFTPMKNTNSVYYGDYRSIGQDLIHEKRADIPVWVTSRPWADGPDFVENIRRDIYESKANAVIPWALISGAKQWMESNGEYNDGSMKSGFTIKEDGSLVIQDRYYFYKQVTRAGQPGMQVAEVINLDPGIGAIAFAQGNSNHKNAFVVINKTEEEKVIELVLEGVNNNIFVGFRSSDDEKYDALGELSFSSGLIKYACPARSVSTFFEK